MLKQIKRLKKLQSRTGPLHTTHCRVDQGKITATDGTVTIGCFVDETVSAGLHTDTLYHALVKCGDNYKFIHDEKSFIVRAGRLRVKVPTLSLDQLPPMEPDPPTQFMNNTFIEAIDKIRKIPTAKAERVLCASIKLTGPVAVASDSKLVAEVQHGHHFDKDLIVPVQFFNLIDEVRSEETGKITTCGYSDKSITVFFEDNSFIKTQLYEKGWPDHSHIFASPGAASTINSDIYQGIETVKPFCETSLIKIEEGVVKAVGPGGNHTASYDTHDPINELEGVYNLTHLNHVKGVASSFDATSDKRCVYFFGDGFRAALAKYVD